MGVVVDKVFGAERVESALQKLGHPSPQDISAILDAEWRLYGRKRPMAGDLFILGVYADEINPPHDMSEEDWTTFCRESVWEYDTMAHLVDWSKTT